MRPKPLFGLINVRIVQSRTDARSTFFWFEISLLLVPFATQRQLTHVVVIKNLLQRPPVLCRMVLRDLDRLSSASKAKRAEIGQINALLVQSTGIPPYRQLS
jgi:hypothetical protein